MQTDQVLSHLKKHGQLLDLEIAAGDKVRIMECRPLSKTVSFVVVEKR